MDAEPQDKTSVHNARKHVPKCAKKMKEPLMLKNDAMMMITVTAITTEWTMRINCHLSVHQMKLMLVELHSVGLSHPALIHPLKPMESHTRSVTSKVIPMLRLQDPVCSHKLKRLYYKVFSIHLVSIKMRLMKIWVTVTTSLSWIESA